MIRFDDRDQREADRSNLLIQAAMLRDAGDVEQAVERFADCARIDEQLADEAESENEFERALRLRYSAASAWAHAGDFHRSLTLLRTLESQPNVTTGMRSHIDEFARRVRSLRDSWLSSLRESLPV